MTKHEAKLRAEVHALFFPVKIHCVTIMKGSIRLLGSWFNVSAGRVGERSLMRTDALEISSRSGSNPKRD